MSKLRYRKRSAVVALSTLAAFACAADAKVVISEVLYNEVGSDTRGEWVEILNTGNATVDISDYKFGDEETRGGDTESGGMFKFPANTLLAAGQAVVITGSAERFFAVYGFKPSFEWYLNGVTTGVDDIDVPNMVPYTAWLDPAEVNNMSNTNDQAILLRLDDGGNDVIADAVSWGNIVAFDPGLNATVLDGQSYYRISLEDTDTAADWALSPDTGVAATRSSPFVAVPEPASISLLTLAGLIGARRRRKG